MPFIVISTLVVGIFCIVVGAFFSQDHTNALAVVWSRLTCGIVPVKVKLTGKNNYHQRRSYVVVANHQSMVDIPVVHGFIGLHIKWVIKQELRKIPVFGAACHYLGCIFVDRSHHNAAVHSIHQAKKRMSSKASVLFFAEGTRSRDGQVQPFKKGAFVFARETGLPVLPVTIKHSREVLPPDSLNLIPGLVEIIVHRPVYVLPGDAGHLADVIRTVHSTISGPLST